MQNNVLIGTNVSTKDLQVMRNLIENVYKDLETKMKEISTRRQTLSSAWGGRDANAIAPKLDDIFVKYQNFANTYSLFLNSLDKLIQNYDQEEEDFLTAIVGYNSKKKEDDEVDALIASLGGGIDFK